MDDLDVRPLTVENESLLTCTEFYLIVVSIFSKTCVKDHGDSASRLLESRM